MPSGQAVRRRGSPGWSQPQHQSCWPRSSGSPENETKRGKVEDLGHRLVIGHDMCEAEQQKLAMRDEWAAFERMRPVVDAAQAWRHWFPSADSMFVPENALIAAVDAYDDYTGEDLAELHLEPVTPDVLEIAAAATRYFPNPDIRAELVDDDHPERICCRCGGSNVRAWCAPSPLWNQVMRGGDINGKDRFDGIVCPVCFAQLAEEQGIAQRWRFYAERVHVELATVTPSGRVWNPDKWLWEEPAAPAEDGGEAAVHAYVSTACQHGLHDKCRLTCKYCGDPCVCSGCDHTQPATEE